MKNISEILAGVEETPTTFEDYLKAYADPVGELINSYIPHGAHGDMDRYLYDPLYHYSENAGKRHRPLICFAACLAVGGDPNRAATAAAAIEHFHSAALIHDDIAAEAELRQWAAEQDKYLTGRFSPGYGDWPIGVQPLVAAALDTARRAGLCVTENDLMTPRKSVTALLGLSDHPVKGRLAGCGHCVLNTRCEYRKRGKTCASE